MRKIKITCYNGTIFECLAPSIENGIKQFSLKTELHEMDIKIIELN